MHATRARRGSSVSACTKVVIAARARPSGLGGAAATASSSRAVAAATMSS
jgi:hypothetical protein